MDTRKGPMSLDMFLTRLCDTRDRCIAGFFGFPIPAPSVREGGGASTYTDVMWRLRSQMYAETVFRTRKGRELERTQRCLRKHTWQP